MKKTLAIILTLVMVFSAFTFVYAEEDYVGAKLIGKDTIVGTGSETVDVEVELQTSDVDTLDSVYFKAVPDEGLKMKSIMIPEEYAKYDDLTNDSFARNNIVWISNSNYNDFYEAAPTATFVITYEIEDPTLETTYNINICEEAAMFNTLQCSEIMVSSNATVTVKSSDATLNYILLDGETVCAVDPDVTEYTYDVANDVTEVLVDAITNHDEATFEIEGDTTDLVVGENVVTIKTTAADEKTQIVYTFTIVRAPSDDTTLADLTINGETIEGFEPEGEYYELEVENDITTLDIGVVTNHENATYEIEGNEDFAVGENEVLVTVTAEDGESKYYYTIMVTRLPSTDTSLADLTINGETIEGFGPEVEYYEIEVENDVTTLDVGVVTNHENAVFDIVGNEELVVGENEILITVTAEDEKTLYYYTIMVNRLPSTDATLKEIYINDVSIGELDPESFEYMFDVDYLTKEIQVGAVPNHNEAMVTCDDTVALELGANNINISVLAEDGVTTLDYVVTVIRPEAPVMPIEANIVDSESEEVPYESYSVTEQPDGIVEITIEGLAKHKNGAGEEGYWAGFALVAPEGAVYANYAFVEDDIENADPTFVGTFEENVDGLGNVGLMFLTDVKSEAPKKYVAIQWLDADEDPLTGVIKYEMDLTNITFAEIILEDGVNATITSVTANDSMTDDIGTIYTVEITDETIVDKVPVSYVGDEIVGTVLYSEQRDKYVVVVPKGTEDVVLKAVNAEDVLVTEFVYGDVVGNDSLMNSNDVQTITVRIKGIADNVNTVAKMIAADVDGNGIINSNDVQAMKVSLKGITPLAILSR